MKAGVSARIFTLAVNTGPLANEILENQGANIVFPTMTMLSDKWRELMASLS